MSWQTAKLISAIHYYCLWFYCVKCILWEGLQYQEPDFAQAWKRDYSFHYLCLCYHAVKWAGVDRDLGIFNWCDISLCFFLKHHAVKHRGWCHATTLKSTDMTLRQTTQTHIDKINALDNGAYQNLAHSDVINVEIAGDWENGHCNQREQGRKVSQGNTQ